LSALRSRCCVIFTPPKITPAPWPCRSGR
jgi:hypothetical protein